MRLGWWLSSEEHDPRALVEHAASAEAAGFRSAMLSDHLQPWVAAQGNAPYAWTVIGALSAATTTLEVGTGVTSMVHRQSPITVAQAAATAAVMLEDRFFVGLETGERLNEQAFGRRWPRTGERREQLAEAVPLIRRLLDGGLVNHRGQWWSVENLRLTTLPAEPPPILIAASGPRSAQLAGEAGDGMIGVAPDARLVERFRSAGGTGRRCVEQLHVSLAACPTPPRPTPGGGGPRVPSRQRCSMNSPFPPISRR